MLEKIIAYARTCTDIDRSAAIIDALAGDKSAIRYLTTVYKHAHPTPDTTHRDETRALIIQLDEMGILDSM